MVNFILNLRKLGVEGGRMVELEILYRDNQTFHLITTSFYNLNHCITKITFLHLRLDLFTGLLRPIVFIVKPIQLSWVMNFYFVLYSPLSYLYSCTGSHILYKILFGGLDFELSTGTIIELQILKI